MDANTIKSFRDIALLELKRAERYRNFLSILILNFSEFLATAGRRRISSPEDAEQFIAEVRERVRRAARETDMVGVVNDSRLVMLLPETDRDNAQTAGERFQDLISEFLGEYLQSEFDFEVPVEVVSFPDTTGDVTLKSRVNSLFTEN